MPAHTRTRGDWVPWLSQTRSKSGQCCVLWDVAGMKMQENSASVPFLTRPAALDGSMVGDVGFDPLGFSAKYPLNWLREAELQDSFFSSQPCAGGSTQGSAHDRFVLPEFLTAVHRILRLSSRIFRSTKWLLSSSLRGARIARNLRRDGRTSCGCVTTPRWRARDDPIPYVCLKSA